MHFVHIGFLCEFTLGTHLYSHTHTHTHTHTYTHTLTHTRTHAYTCTHTHIEGASKSTSANDVTTAVSNNILSTLQLSEMVAASGTGATAESLLQSVVNLVGAAQAVAAVTSSAESAATATAEDTGKGVYLCVCTCVCVCKCVSVCFYVL